MKKIILATAIFVAVNNFCFAEEEEKNEIEKPKEYSVAVYIHPISLLSLTAHLSDNNERYLYATIEIPRSPSTSIIIRPSIWKDVSEFTIFGKAPVWDRFGTDVGARYYTNNKGNGFYLQGTVGLFYGKNKSVRHYDNNVVDVDIMGYIGNSIKPKKTNLSIFFDVGLGVGSNRFWGDEPPIFDINIGIGYRF